MFQQFESPFPVPEKQSASLRYERQSASRCRDAHQLSRSFARWNQSLRYTPNSNQLCSDLSLGRRQLNGELGNSRDASVHADDAKSRFPRRVATALRRRNSLRMAMQIGGRARPCYRFRDCGPNSAQAEQSGETVSPISL